MVMSVGLGAVAVKNRVDSDRGLGREGVHVAQIVGPEGVVDVLDVQPSMLDATRQRTQRHRVHNVATSTPTLPVGSPNPTPPATPHLMSVLGTHSSQGSPRTRTPFRRPHEIPRAAKKPGSVKARR